MRTLFLILIPLLLISAIADTHAGIYGVIAGKIVDSENNPIVGATVLAVEAKRGAVAKSDGSYVILKLMAGKHTLQIKALGYVSTTQTVTIVADSTITLPTIRLVVDTSPKPPVKIEAGPKFPVYRDLENHDHSYNMSGRIPLSDQIQRVGIQDKSHVRSLSLPGRETTIENASMAIPGVFIAP